jgi:hypothetical protein
MLQALSEELSKTVKQDISAEDEGQNICVMKYSAVVIVYISYMEYKSRH